MFTTGSVENEKLDATPGERAEEKARIVIPTHSIQEMLKLTGPLIIIVHIS